jgi:hypothetical protein
MAMPHINAFAAVVAITLDVAISTVLPVGLILAVLAVVTRR